MKPAIYVRSKDKRMDALEILNAHHEVSLENDGKVLFTTNVRFTPLARPKIDQVVMYVDADNAYLVDVVAVGPGYPDSLTKIPAGFNTPKLWENEDRNSWMALEGEWKLIDPAEYALDSNPAKTLPEVFGKGRAYQAYVHKKDLSKS